jgi:uncharacterized repeat protein (TIGR01451 family)
VKDTLPIGVSFLSASGTGSYSNATGVWTVGSLVAGANASITLNVTVNATAGATITNSAEISASSASDPDSTPNNASTAEDDDDAVSFTVSGTRTAGTPPSLVCPVGSTLFDWAANSWPVNSLNNSFPQAGVGTFNIGITSNTALVAGSPAISTALNGGITGESGLFNNMNNSAQSDVSTTTITLPGALPGVQFRVFDIDFGSASYADKIVVSGSFKGVPVTPTLTNGTSNYVAGNTAVGDLSAADTSAAGTVYVTFLAAVDTIIVQYGNHTSAPANPGNQWMSVHDFTLCLPQVSLSVSKTSVVYNSGSSPQFMTPDNDALYTITVTNSGTGSLTDDSIFVVDPLPSQLTFYNGDTNGPSVSGTDAIIFTDNNSGLTFTNSTDVRYATGTTTPTSLSQCTYTPSAGYDANVRYICLNPKGRMTGKSGASNPGFSVQFRARIQ